MKSLIRCSGEVKDYNFLRNLILKCDYIVCADGGINHLLKIGEKPDIVIGDLDSASKEALEYIKKNNIKVEKFPSKKNMTDTELCIEHCISKKYKDINLAGAIGGRIDHTLANILLLRRYFQTGVKLSIVDGKNIVNYLNGKIEIEKKQVEFNLSIVPLSLEGIIVSIDGVLYPLEHKQIEYGSTLGISNFIEDKVATVNIHKGEALIVESRD